VQFSWRFNAFGKFWQGDTTLGAKRRLTDWSGKSCTMSFEATKVKRPILALTFLLVLPACSPYPAEAKRSFEERYALAEKYRLANDYPNGLREYTGLVKVRPADSRMHANLGFILVQVGKFKEAKEEIDKAIILNDEDPSAHQALAMYYMLQGDKKNARLEYIKTISLDPKRNCHCGGIQGYLGITAADEKKAKREAARHGRMPSPTDPSRHLPPADPNKIKITLP
jgi:tetratricopeptide (TPR) repeat protein